MKFKVLIIGAGITGSSIARVLSAYENLEITLIEREPDVGWGVTKANTALIHPGHEDDPDIHPVRASLCAEGNRLWHKWIEELDIPTKWTGELMLATNEEERQLLKRYVEIGRKNGVPGLRVIWGEELRKLEPLISERVIAALWAPTAGQIAPWEATIALVENAVSNGVKLLVNTKVEEVVIERGKVKGVNTNRGLIEADVVINAAGLHADEISETAGINSFKIMPRRGEYMLFDDQVDRKPMRILHGVPTPKSKGVFYVTTVEGNPMIGPTAEDLPFEAKSDRRTTRDGQHLLWEEVSKLVSVLPPRNRLIKLFSGLRPEPTGGDFIIEAYDEPWGFINVAGIRSPGLTAAPAIAYKVRDMLADQLKLPLYDKTDWNPYRKSILKFSKLLNTDNLEASILIKREKSYGNVICFCKAVTEAEIVEAIRRMKAIGVEVTIDGVKFRTMAGFGPCQGNFCRLRVARIIARELGIPLWEVTYRGKGTEYAIGNVKSLQMEEVMVQ